MTNILRKWNSISLVKRIICGLIVGAILGLAIPGVTGIGILGTLFVSALKAIAPVLVFFLVIAALACGNVPTVDEVVAFGKEVMGGDK